MLFILLFLYYIYSVFLHSYKSLNPVMKTAFRRCLTMQYYYNNELKQAPECDLSDTKSDFSAVSHSTRKITRHCGRTVEMQKSIVFCPCLAKNADGAANKAGTFVAHFYVK